ncbi:MAG: efflux RND transporter permease subunit [Opitutales bacterium]|nr:efflux RND transporter permease subunit [Opitutales bacterium]
MMNSLIAFCLRKRWTVILLTLLLIAASVFVVKNTPVDVFPELRVPRVTIQTEAGGLTAEEVERYVTIPVESAMNGTAGVKEVRSSSGGGLSFVWVDFDWDTDIYLARQIVTERLSSVRSSLPQNVSPELAPIVSVTGEIMLIALTPDASFEKLSEAEKNQRLLDMRQLAEYRLRNRLLAIPGVGQVTVLGGRLPEYQIVYDPARLRQANVSIDDLKAAVEAAGSSDPAGYLEDVAGLELPVQQDSRVETLEQIRRSIVPAHISGTVKIEDLAEVKIDGAPRRGNAGFMGTDAIVLSVQKVPGANTQELTRAVDRAVREFSSSQLPDTMQLRTDAYRQSDFIELSLANGGETLISAGIVVMLVIFLTLLNIRTALITLAAMPLSVLFAFLLFPAFDLAINIMTLGGLAVAVGDVVDNAIIFVEIAWRKLSENAALPPDRRRSKFDVLMGAKDEILGSIGYSSAIILLVFAPVLFLSGLEGQFFRPLGISYMLAFGMSLIVAVTVIPALCSLAFRKKLNANAAQNAPEQESFSVRQIRKLYAPVLNFSLRRSKIVVAGTLLLTAAALWLASTFGASFLPPFNEDCYTVFVNAVPGTSLEETERIARQCAKKVETIDGVISVAQRTGRAENDEHAEPVSASELLVRVDLKKDQRELRAKIQEAIEGIPGTSTMIGYPLAHRISAALSGSNSEMAINIYGAELPQLRAAALKAKEILEKLPEVADARANREVMVDTIRIRYNQEILGAYGLTIAEAAEQVSTAINGAKLGEVIKNQDRWNIVMRIDPALRLSIDDVRHLELIGNNGRSVRLGEAADVSREEITNLILRDNTLRKAMISCNPAPDSNLGDLVKACREKLDPAMHELGCTVEYAGTIQARESAAQRLYLLGAAILIAIVFLLTAALGSLRNALVTLVNIPLCIIGGIVAVFIASPGTLASVFGHGHYIAPIISVASIVGFVTVIGFGVRSGLILMNRYRDLSKQGMATDEAIRVGSLERVVPIIMTSLTTELGLLPLIFAIDQPGGELLGPLAIVQFGGLISATVLSLLVIPAASKLLGK